MKKVGRVVVVVGTVLLATVLQAQNSQVSGQIRDTTNAAVSDATLTLTRIETGDHRDLRSSGEGYYSFPTLLPGHYELKVEKEGFQPQTQTGIVVETGSIRSVDVTLKVGSAAEVVNVDAALPLLQAESSSVSNVVENKTITNLPL